MGSGEFAGPAGSGAVAPLGRRSTVSSRRRCRPLECGRRAPRVDPGAGPRPCQAPRERRQLRAGRRSVALRSPPGGGQGRHDFTPWSARGPSGTAGANPKNRANRLWRWRAYHCCRARSRVRRLLVASIVVGSFPASPQPSTGVASEIGASRANVVSDARDQWPGLSRIGRRTPKRRGNIATPGQRGCASRARQ